VIVQRMVLNEHCVGSAILFYIVPVIESRIRE
jgi:hypothetical protein